MEDTVDLSALWKSANTMGNTWYPKTYAFIGEMVFVKNWECSIVMVKTKNVRNTKNTLMKKNISLL